MEFDTKSRDYPSFPPMISSENYMEPGFGDGFFLGGCSSKGSIQDFPQFPSFPPMISSENYMEPGFGDGFFLGGCSSKGSIQDFPQFDQFHVDNLQENSKSGVLPPYFDHFDTLVDGSSSALDVSEPKSFMEASGKRVMENFQNRVSMNCPSRIMPYVIEPDRMDSPSFNFQDVQSPNLPSLHEEISCVTANQNRLCMEIRMNRKKNSSSTSKVQKKTNMVKGKWTAEEDSLLLNLVSLHGERNWSNIAQKMNGRIGKQCRERWNNHLRPNIKKDSWSVEEEKILVEAHAQMGNRWADIAKRLSKRPDNSVKNYWNTTARRLSKRRYRSPVSQNPCSPLENYIRSLSATSQIADNNQMNGTMETNVQIVNPIINRPTQPDLANSCASDHLVPNHNYCQTSDSSFDLDMFLENYEVETTFDEVPVEYAIDEGSSEMK